MTPGPGSQAIASRAGGSPAITLALATLTDVAGIAGSFVFTSNGRLIAREIHAMFDDGTLTEAAERLARLQETFGAVGDQLELAVMRFQAHKLYMKTLAGGVLCVLAEDGVNMAALRMAANLVGRRITPELATLEAQEQTTRDAAAAAAVPMAPMNGVGSNPNVSGIWALPRAPVVAPGTGRRFRGRRVE